MPTVKLKGLHKVNAKGQTYYYAWRGGPRIEAKFGTPEFFDEWSAARAPASHGDEKWFKTWVVKFRHSDEYTKGFGERTKKEWNRWLDKIEARFGLLHIAQFDRPQIRSIIKKWRDKWSDKPRTADYAKQVLSRVCAYAVSEGKLRLNPCTGVPNVYGGANRADIIWRREDVEAICAVSPPEIQWVVWLAYLTGFRQSDLLKLRWDHIGKWAIEITASKSKTRKKPKGKKATPPLTQEIRNLLDRIPKRSVFVLTSTKGTPWRGFNSSWQKLMAKAGLDLHFHDFRGSAATNFYRAKFSVREIAAFMAWDEESVERLIDVYVKKDEIQEDRVRRLESFTTGQKA